MTENQIIAAVKLLKKIVEYDQTRCFGPIDSTFSDSNGNNTSKYLNDGGGVKMQSLIKK